MDQFVVEPPYFKYKGEQYRSTLLGNNLKVNFRTQTRDINSEEA